MLAQMLQLQFDQEYDRNLGKEEAKYNGSSKGFYTYSIKIVTAQSTTKKYLCSCCFVIKLPKNTKG